MELYEEVKDKIRKKGHTATVKRERLADDCGPAQCISSQKKNVQLINGASLELLLSQLTS